MSGALVLQIAVRHGVEFLVDKRYQGLERLLISSSPSHKQLAHGLGRNLGHSRPTPGLGWLKDSLAIGSSQFLAFISAEIFLTLFPSQFRS
jgi:hypothetical protein